MLILGGQVTTLGGQVPIIGVFPRERALARGGDGGCRVRGERGGARAPHRPLQGAHSGGARLTPQGEAVQVDPRFTAFGVCD
jgi:hypothetical protein